MEREPCPYNQIWGIFGTVTDHTGRMLKLIIVFARPSQNRLVVKV